MIQLSCPGKTFLCGEYGVLSKGRALVLLTAPRFKLIPTPLVTDKIRKENSVISMREFHPDSPAGKLMKANAGPWSEFSFVDPYLGQGGFGASTAQFIFAYSILQWNTQKITFESDWLNNLINLNNIRAEYLKHSDLGNPPSGMDVLSQILGQVSLVCADKVEGESFSWPFSDLDFFIVPTGIKLATHEHLKEISLDKIDVLLPISEIVMEAFIKMDSEGFVHAIRAWAQSLANAGFLANSSADIINRLASVSGVRAIKGCGAMGADTLLVIVDGHASLEFQKTLNENPGDFGITSPLKILSKKDLSSGLGIH